MRVGSAVVVLRLKALWCGIALRPGIEHMSHALEDQEVPHIPLLTRLCCGCDEVTLHPGPHKDQNTLFKLPLLFEGIYFYFLFIPPLMYVFPFGEAVLPVFVLT